MKLYYWCSLIYFVTAASDLELGITVSKLNCTANSIKHFQEFYKTKNMFNCLQLIMSSEPNNCFFEQILNTKFSYFVRTIENLLKQNIYMYNVLDELSTLESNWKSCKNLIIFINNTEQIMGILSNSTPFGDKEKRFFPFSDILVISQQEPNWKFDNLVYINDNALHVFWTSYENMSFSNVKYVLTNKTIPVSDYIEVNKTLKMYQVHPFLETVQIPDNKRKVFRVSLFNCPPYVLMVNTSRQVHFNNLSIKSK